MISLYDHQGVLRFTGHDRIECIEYAELFALAAGTYSITCLEKGDWAGEERTAADLPHGAPTGAAELAWLA